ncbi:MAG: hypothetical protein HKN89_04065 [Eudoraea sp.]|nr:hypothetical protein [Eudoraea sp.]
MTNQNACFLTIFLNSSGTTILRKSLVAFILLFLYVTPAYGKTCSPEIWAADCYIHVNSPKTSLTFYVECSGPEIADKVTLEISSTGYPQKDGFLPHISRSETKNNFNYGVFIFENLNVNTNYNYVLKVRDQNSCETFASGSVGTSKRNLQLRVDKIHIIDDADDLDNGELVVNITASEQENPENLVKIKIGDKNSEWAESGKTYTINKTATLSNINHPVVNLDIYGSEWDVSSGFWLDQGGQTIIEKVYENYSFNLAGWELEDKTEDQWSVRVKGFNVNDPDFRLYFRGELEYEKGDYNHTSYPNIQSIKPKPGVKPESLDKAKKLVYIPPPPEIKAPIENKLYLSVPVDIDIRFTESPDWITTTALDIQFFFTEGGTWPYLETVITGYDGSIPGEEIVGSIIPVSGDIFQKSIPNANFTKKGTWGLRARVLVKSGPSDNWVIGNFSENRTFAVNTLDTYSANKFGLAPIIIKSPKGTKKWVSGSNMQIKWLATGVTKRTKITILKKNGAQAGVIADNIIPPPPQPSGQSKEMTYNWRVGDKIIEDKIKGATAQPQSFKIRIEEKGKYSAESDMFEIIAPRGALTRSSMATRSASSANNQRRQSPSTESASSTPQAKKKQPTPSKSLRILSPRSNQSFNSGVDVIVKIDHDSRFPVKYELRKDNARKFSEVKLTKNALKNLNAGNYSLRISYRGEAPTKTVNFTIRNMEKRTQEQPRAQPQTSSDSQQPTNRARSSTP